MATKTLGTNGTNTLTAMSWNPMSPIADIATIAEALQAQNPFGRNAPQLFANNGRLQFPGRRGFLLLQPNDWIGVDSNGWPIVVSNQSIAGALAATSWTHS
jgi:hypothetical protein